MATSFSQELEELLNPLPKFPDPEDDEDETTKAKVIEEFNEDDDEEEFGHSVLRKHSAHLLSDTDRRYVGKKVSRKQLVMDIEGSDSAEDEDDDDDDGEEVQEVQEVQGDDIDDLADEEDSIENEVSEDDIENDDEEMVDNDNPDVNFPQGVDFRKLTDGMDDLGVSEDDDDSGQQTEGSDDDSDSDVGDEDDGTVHTFSQEKTDEEVEKGKAVKNQLALWDQLLESRIKIQKALVTVNQLPQPDTFPEFKRRGGAKMAAELKTTHKALKALQRSLLELHDQLLLQKGETRAVAQGETGELDAGKDIKSEDENDEGSVLDSQPPKRKLEMAEYPDFMAKRFATFQPYQNATLQKWHDKTRLTIGKSTKGFGAFDRNILTQVEQVLMDKERLVRRTQTRRSEYRVLGKNEAPALINELFPEGKEAEQHLEANTHLKDLDEDIFDDDDFYHQLLRELIEHKTSSSDTNDQVAMGRQWLAIQKLRSKIKKKVDTKASKGRKVKFQIHSKLVNFMAPMNHSATSDKARSELYRGLFGQVAAARE